MNISEENYLAHYGILRKSGRYPWGSGDTQSERNQTFLSTVDGLRKKGLSETVIAEHFGLTTTQLRAAKSIAKNEERQEQIAMAQRLKNKGYSNVAIGKRMGIPESTVRTYLAPGAKDRADVLVTTSNMLKDQVAKNGLIDIGSGVEHHLGISQTKLSTAVARLKEEGYGVHYIKVEQLGTGNQTTVKVLAGPGVTYSEVYKNRANIKQAGEFSQDGGRSYVGIQKPLSVSSKRIGVRYAEDGGSDADGVIYVRPGVSDLSLGSNRYAQVRIAVDGSHYLKGMAIYKDDLPAGTDLVFNTNKRNTGNKLDAMKAMKDDPENPFGATVRQIIERDPKTGEPKVKSAMNLVNEEADWDKWSSNLSSQMLSKQSPSLAKEQLAKAYQKKQKEYDEIMALTNPTVRKKLLEGFAEDADASAVHLKAAPIPGQKTHVILPMNSLKSSEIYAPNYNNGDRVALVRYPHGGIFEIPELTVNNRHPQAKALMGNARNAVGINSKVAARLSGADFDGDTVLVIPNNDKKIKSAPALAGLTDFDPVRDYPGYPGMKQMSARDKAMQMGDVSNLITDMTIKGANAAELARAVRHSMVVIDAEKHNLNYKQSAKDNGIAQLKEKYQGKANAGASTLISRATSRQDVLERTPRSAAKGGAVDPATGKKMYENTNRSWVDAQGNTVFKKQRSTKLAETDDANTLSSGTPIEKVYADHSNRLKNLANTARKTAVGTKGTPYSPSAKTAYSKEVASLDEKLKVALRNSPLERQAQLLANASLTLKRQANPDMEASEIKKLKGQELAKARAKTGAGKTRVEITDSEWAAIQAGAISTSKLSQILNNADLDRVKALATPRTASTISSSNVSRARAMLRSGATQAEVARALGISIGTLTTALSE